MPEFLCGAARHLITPPVGTELYGYEPGIFSTCVHDDLTATALAFGSGREAAMLISLTLGDLQTALCGEMRQEAFAASGIPADCITVASTHTHTAPNVSGMEGWGNINRDYIDSILLPAIREAAREAAASMTPAEMGCAAGDSLVGVNRRVTFPDGSVDFGQSPDAPFDPAMTILSFRRADTHEGIVSLVHYGCHGTACGKGHEITRDWSGIMLDRLEEVSGTMAVYFNGALGDVGPRISNGKTTGDITYVHELGGRAAADALRVYGQITDYTVPAFSLHGGTVHLPRKPLPPLEDVQAALAQIADPDSLVNIDRMRYAHLRDTEAAILAGGCGEAPDYTFGQLQVQVGGVLFVPCPFEPFTNICLKLRRESGLPHTLVLSCANGYEGYLPTQDELDRGGYEVGVFRYVSLHPLTDDADERLAAESLRILHGN